MMVSAVFFASVLLAAVTGSYGNVDGLINDIEDDTSFDILAEEGQPGWFEKILEMGQKLAEESQNHKSGTGVNGKTDKREFYSDLEKREKASSLAETKLTEAFNEIGKDADGAKTGLAKIKSKWKELSSDKRSSIVNAFRTSAAQFDKFSKANENPVGAVMAAADIVSQFTALAGPTGQIISVALSFVSGFLALFGVGKSNSQKPDFTKIVRKEIDQAFSQYYEKVLHDQVAGAIYNFEISKAYVDSLSKSGGQLSEHQALSLKVHVPLWKGLGILGKLELRIKEMLDENKRETVYKVLKYIDLYARIATLKDMILLQSIALLPDERNRAALLAAQMALREKQKTLLEFLLNAQLNSKLAVRYFDADKYPIANKYLTTILKVPDIDRSLAGTWCIDREVRISGWWSTKPRLVYRNVGFGGRYRELRANGHPYLQEGGWTCRWKILPHGNNLFTIGFNDHLCSKNEARCRYISHDLVGSSKSSLRITMRSDADFWEIIDKNGLKRIRSKWGCEVGKKMWCDTSPFFREHRIKRPYRYEADPPINVLYLGQGGFEWKIKKYG